MNLVFTEEMIREELRRLDKKTGLHGATLKITFGNTRSRLGYFSYRDKNSLEFYFSNLYFADRNFPTECKLDIIRHEYAHYMDYIRNGSSSHGQQWKICCNIVGALPIRCYRDSRSQYFREKHEKESSALEKCEAIAVGTEIIHSSFGKGIVEEIFGTGLGKSATVLFSNGLKKKLSIKWLTENCV